MNIQETITKSH